MDEPLARINLTDPYIPTPIYFEDADILSYVEADIVTFARRVNADWDLLYSADDHEKIVGFQLHRASRTKPPAPDSGKSGGDYEDSRDIHAVPPAPDRPTREDVARLLFERGRGAHDAESWAAAGEEMQQWILGHADAILALFSQPPPSCGSDETRAVVEDLRAVVPYQGKSKVAFLCHSAADLITTLAQRMEETQQARDERERQFQEKVTEISGLLDALAELKAQGAGVAGLDKAIQLFVEKYEDGENHGEGAYDDGCIVCRMLAELRVTLAASPPPPRLDDGWRDIESAPKDGTMVLLYQPDTMGAYMDAWVSNTWQECRFLKPSHWRPVPPPPQVDGGGS